VDRHVVGFGQQGLELHELHLVVVLDVGIVRQHVHTEGIPVSRELGSQATVPDDAERRPLKFTPFERVTVPIPFANVSDGLWKVSKHREE
jgi:hypothetical protein